MLQKIRSKSNSLAAKVLAGIICFVLAVFGFGAFNLFAVSEPEAASVNGEDITIRELSAAIDRQKDRFEQQYDEELSEDVLERLIDESLILEQLISRKLLEQNAGDLGLVNSRREFMRQIEDESMFQDEGEFSIDKYRQVLASAGYSVQSYEQLTGLDNVVEQITNVNLQTGFLMPTEKRQSAAIGEQVRDVAFMEFKTEDFREGIEIEPEDLMAYYEFNLDDFISEESFVFQTVSVSIQTYMEEIEVSDDELETYYGTVVEAEQSNAQRRGSHILLNTDERTKEEAIILLNDFKRRVLEDGESFADLATEHSDDAGSAVAGGDLGMAARGVYVPPFEEALWSLDVGELSDPVESQFGVHLIQLNEIQEIEIKPLADRREDLLAEYRREQAQEPYRNAVDELDKLAFEMPESLDGIAEIMGLEVQVYEDVTRATNDGVFANGSARSALFTDDVILNRYNSKPVNVDEDTTLVGRVDSSTPPTQLTFEEVEEEIRTILVDEEAAKRADKALTSALEELDATQDFGAVETLTGKEWTRLEAMSQMDYLVDMDIREEVFKRSLPSEEGRAYFRLPSTLEDGKEFLVVISNVNLGDYETLTDDKRDEVESSLTRRVENTEMTSYLYSLRGEGSVQYQVVMDDSESLN